MTDAEIQRLREKPASYLAEAIDLFCEMNGQVIVEVGSMRQRLSHPLGQVHPCCNDGHSSILLAQTGREFHSVDIDPNCTAIVEETLRSFGLHESASAHTQDGISFLSQFDGVIDLLFLDAWDIDTPGYAEKHLEAYRAAEDKLATRHLLLIDDTDVDYIDGRLQFVDVAVAGKGRLLVPELLDRGYELVRTGRQTLLAK
ncbi:MAG: hypothetical protein O7G84_15415 [Gammaproteobacteria bacterium]|nr:hypothetical protein [Gammaproteobacteria bacterium]